MKFFIENEWQLSGRQIFSLFSISAEMFTNGAPKASYSAIESKDYESVKGITGSMYKARLPLPGPCLDRIDAAFYFYDLNEARGDDKIYLMSHGFLWVYV